jgi:hypothetical protein
VSALIFGDKIIYTCSKNAGSTIRNLFCDMVILGKDFSCRDLNLAKPKKITPLPKVIINMIQARASIPEKAILEIAEKIGIEYHFGFEATIEGLTPYCIRRDPIKRFESCFSQKLHQPNFYSKVKSIENLIENFDDIVTKPLKTYRNCFSFNDNFKTWQDLIVPRHFAPQSYTYGCNPSKFLQIFEMSEINTKVHSLFENFFGQSLPVRHSNKGKKINLIHPDCYPAIKRLYEIDYASGWG